MIISDEDIKKIEQFIEIKNKNFYVDSKQLQDVYNRVLNTNLSPTNCGSCIRKRVEALEQALNQFKKEQAKNIPPVEEKPLETPENKPRKVGRPKAK